MCGIVGYIGKREAVSVLIGGLQRLEYRGYDSAGIAVIEDGSLVYEKKAGKLAVLAEEMHNRGWHGNVGIGHTRWATHGRPTDENAHPHIDCTGKFAVIHNGIIENYLQLRERLIKKGHVFKSETDTETFVHLIEECYGGDLETAVRNAVAQTKGAYALVVLSQHEPDKIVAVRKTSPMIVGLGEDEFFIASDIPAVLDYTRKIMIVQDDEMVILERDTASIKDFAGNIINREIIDVNWDIDAAAKGGYSHFMLKEINEQPEALRKTMTGRIRDNQIFFDDFGLDADAIKKLERIHIIACGTAYHAGLVGKCAIEQLCRIPVDVDLASEFRYRDPIIGKNDLAIVISQSGETADTLAALREAKSRGIKVLAITNVVGSSVAREADYVLFTWAGPEIAVASTKAYTTQLIVLIMFAVYAAKVCGRLSAADYKDKVAALENVPSLVSDLLGESSLIEKIANDHCSYEDAFFIGRGLDYAVSMEGALKLKEISYIHAEAYAAGELKHGTLALITEGIPVFCLATQKKVYDKTVSNIQEVKARGAMVIGLSRKGAEEVERLSDILVSIPDTDDILMPIITVIPLQLLAYYASVARGCDVDQPRNLAKSVTVE